MKQKIKKNHHPSTFTNHNHSHIGRKAQDPSPSVDPAPVAACHWREKTQNSAKQQKWKQNTLSRILVEEGRKKSENKNKNHKTLVSWSHALGSIVREETTMINTANGMISQSSSSANAQSPGLKTYFKTPEGRYKLHYEKTYPSGLLHYAHGKTVTQVLQFFCSFGNSFEVPIMWNQFWMHSLVNIEPFHVFVNTHLSISDI